MRAEGMAAIYLQTFIDELYANGVEHLVISPGSRSTPLAMTAMRQGKMRIWVHVDERSAAYFALGIAKASHHPVALLCTSGTAAANYMPAVVEASYGRIPLIVLTADRPHELRDVGASQTIDQINLFGKHVKWFVDMPLPESDPLLLKYINRTARRAVAASLQAPAGPVHLNFPFREPLVPDFAALQEGMTGVTSSHLDYRDEAVDEPVVSGRQVLSTDQLEHLFDRIHSATKGLIVCGPDELSQGLTEILTLAGQLNFPVIADPLSNLRSSGRLSPVIMDRYDAFLRVEQMVNELQPDLIIRFGAMPISKAYMLYSEKQTCWQAVIDDGGWRDPVHMADQMIFSDPAELVQSLLNRLNSDGNRVESEIERKREQWLKKWQTINDITSQAINQVLSHFEPLFEGQLFVELARLLPDQAMLFVGNSMPVRDLDTFFPTVPKRIRMLANRGASGIDGLVSSALGAGSVTDAPGVLVLGDLSFYHDINGLLPAKQYQLNLTIVLVNNDGGGIFSFLPQANQPEYFEALFGTPLGLDFSHAARLYEIPFHRIESWDTFQQVFTASLESPGVQIIEVPSERTSNFSLHQRVWQAVEKALNSTQIV